MESKRKECSEGRPEGNVGIWAILMSLISNVWLVGVFSMVIGYAYIFFMKGLGQTPYAMLTYFLWGTALAFGFISGKVKYVLVPFFMATFILMGFGLEVVNGTFEVIEPSMNMSPGERVLHTLKNVLLYVPLFLGFMTLLVGVLSFIEKIKEEKASEKEA